MQDNPTIFWFRNDLRIHDLPALSAAAASGQAVLACYILDDENPGAWRMGEASRWWLHHSLSKLAHDVEELGGSLYLARGRPEAVLADLAESTGAKSVYCSRQYAPWSNSLENRVSASLERHNVDLFRLPGSLLWEPAQVMTRAGTPFKVFTPFWKACKALPEPALPSGRPSLRFWKNSRVLGDKLSDLNLIPDAHNQPQGWGENWQPGEQGGKIRLKRFLDDALALYTAGRDRPGLNATSRLSPHLQFGEISPNRVYHSVRESVLCHPGLASQAEKFLSELGWREFSHHLLVQFPQMPEQEFKPSFTAFPWVGTAESLGQWQEGKTGYPMVDAGMRELRQTGYMHGRVRMVAASFLCKHLLVNWRAGERWFWDSLMDADIANNASSWQWVAGSGADASPYYRIFNPITQGEKFDPEGSYVRRWLPELSALPNRYLYQPWSAPQELLEQCDVRLGDNYPFPVVDHRQARESALAAYAHMKSA